MKMKKMTALLLGTVMLGLVSCEYVTIQPEEVIIPDDPISFATQVAPIFVTAGCTGCHSGSTAPDFRADKSWASLTGGNYVNTADPANSVVVKKIESGHASSASISGSNRAILLKWIEEGAKNN